MDSLNRGNPLHSLRPDNDVPGIVPKAARRHLCVINASETFLFDCLAACAPLFSKLTLLYNNESKTALK